jgi:ATP-dependent helicase HepA
VLARVPAQLDASMERFVVDACQLLGLETAEKSGARAWYLELGGGALVDHLPGVPGGSRFLGTFDRAEGVLREELDFFASGHPLVEGLFQELSDGARGRVALVRLAGTTLRGDGLVLLGRPGDVPLVQALDLDGRPRPEWAAEVLRRARELRGVTPDDWLAGLPASLGEPEAWSAHVRALAERTPALRDAEAVAALRLGG